MFPRKSLAFDTLYYTPYLVECQACSLWFRPHIWGLVPDTLSSFRISTSAFLCC
nr:MAG TPA: Kti11, Kti13 transfer, tRNA modification, Complex [Caudoviricetes sp.]